MVCRDATEVPLAQCGRIKTTGTACTVWQSNERFSGLLSTRCAVVMPACQTLSVNIPLNILRGIIFVLSAKGTSKIVANC